MNATSRRHFLKTGVGLAVGSSSVLSAASFAFSTAPVPQLDKLQPITRNARWITSAERSSRRQKLRQHMARQGHDAVLIEPSSSMEYFTGVKWWISERITAVIIPAEGALMFVTPAFEKSRLKELLDISADIITWEEDEDPFSLIAAWLKQRGLEKSTIALDESVRHFVAYQLKSTTPKLTVSSARTEINACRMIKSSAEIALMQLANDVTIQAYRAVFPLIKRGMKRDNIISLMYQAQSRLGGMNPAGGAQIGKGSALPHGSTVPESVEPGAMVLMDFGCTVGGYRSDISRTFVFGKASDAQKKLWQHVYQGQNIAFEAAQPGRPAREVDIAVRKYYEKLGYGPDYRLPGLSHRTGHGIGLDIHEPINFVRNETMPLRAGMCLSNEPGLYWPGKYGVRLEDCLYITEDGPRWFSTPPASLEEPMA